jgi:hypothetical protein
MGVQLKEGWTDIGQVDAARNHTFGLRSDGTVVSCVRHISDEAFVIPDWHLNSPIPSPASSARILLLASRSALIDSDPEKPVPIGVGPLASGRETLRLQVNLGPFEGPVDLYLAIFIPDVDPVSTFILKPDMTLQKHEDGIIPWKTNVEGSVSETLFVETPASFLPASTYHVYLAATHAGKDFSSSYCVWSTRYEVGKGIPPAWLRRLSRH